MKLERALPTVLLPIETAKRELDSKLAVASFLAARGCRVVVGSKEAVAWIGVASRRTVWQGKDAFSLSSPPTAMDHFADRVLANGSAVMFIQDEGGIFPIRSWKETVLTKHRADYLRERRLSRVCTWGEREKDVLGDHGVTDKNPIAVTGSPRFDLCSPAYAWIKNAAIDKASANLRPYILMCTRFTNVVHSEGMDRLFRLADPGATRLAADRHLGVWRRDALDLADYMMLVGALASEYTDLDIVLRPHPSEDAGFYRHAFAPFASVKVIVDGSALDWIRGAELVVHTNCTTGIEAVLAGRRVLNLLPDAIPRENLDKAVASEAGVIARSVSDGVEKAGALLASPPPLQTWSADAVAMLNNLKTDAIAILAGETLAVMAEQRIDSSEIVLPPTRPVRDLARHWFQRPAATDYVGSKRGTLDEGHVEMLLDGCRRKHDGGGRVCHLTPAYVVIEPQ